MALRTKSDFIPNDVKLGGKLGRIALLTGSYDSALFLELLLTPLHRA
jgi:DNA mismatch repair protein MSH6